MQNAISKWTLYPFGRLSVTFGNNYGDFTSKDSYIQWAGTGLNIQADWQEENNKKRIETLSFYYWDDSGIRKKDDSFSYSVDDLELKLSDKEPNDKLKEFCINYIQKRMALIDVEIKNKLEKVKNVVLTGAPGTGKTFLAEKIAKHLTDNKPGCYAKVQFHPSYDYTDFVEGLRPWSDPQKTKAPIVFKYMPGSFMLFCAKAALAQKTNETENQKYVFIIDEINRGELNKIFGEVFSCIEDGYRGEEHRIETQYKNVVSQKITIDGQEVDNPFKDGFYIPDNVFIIGTMNDIDRSVESIDFALRRRFVWINIGWDYSLYDMIKNLKYDKTILVNCLRDLNDKICSTEGMNESYCIGGAFLKKLELVDRSSEEDALDVIWKDRISNVIREYLRGSDLDIDKALGEFRNAFLKPARNKK